MELSYKYRQAEHIETRIFNSTPYVPSETNSFLKAFESAKNGKGVRIPDSYEYDEAKKPNPLLAGTYGGTPIYYQPDLSSPTGPGEAS